MSYLTYITAVDVDTRTITLASKPSDVASVSLLTVLAASALEQVGATTPVSANLTQWKGDTPADLDGRGRVPVGSIREIALSSFDGNDSTVTASDPTQANNYLVGLIVALEFTYPIP